MTGIRLLIATTLLVIALFSPFQASVADHFHVLPLASADNEKIAAILQPLAAKWLPAEELARYPDLYWQKNLQKQSFRIQSSQKGLEDVYFVPIQADYRIGMQSQKQWAQCLSLLIINRQNSSISPLPIHPVMEWSFDSLEAVSFRDVQGHGKRAIIVHAAGITGIGPIGSEPFTVFAVYLPTTDGAWLLDDALQQHIERHIYQECQTDDCRTIDEVVRIATDYFRRKNP